MPALDTTFVPWPANRADRLAQLVSRGLVGEHLTPSELRTNLWEDPAESAILGPDGGRGAVAMVVRDQGPERKVGYVRLLVVDPAARNQGLGRSLLAQAQAWLYDRGVDEIRIGGDAPFYLWPGVDVGWTAALSLFESAGYRDEGSVLNLSCPSSFCAIPSTQLTVGPIHTEQDATDVANLVEREWPLWRSEVMRAVQGGSCVMARAQTGVAIGFGCHSVNRAGWIGPLGATASKRGSGIGSAILGELCRQISATGRDRCEIAWIGPIGFYAKVADAHVSRVFQQRVRRRG